MTNIDNHNGTATKKLTEIRVRGRNQVVPSVIIQERSVVIPHRWPRLASLKDEEFADKEAFEEPASFFATLKASGLGADLFTFIQIFPDIEPKYPYHLEWDNVAALPVTSFDDWHNNQINGNQRRILKRSYRRGVTVEKVDFSDELVRGIMEIYNETPIRQGRAFWHYGKNFETIKAEAGTYLDRSIFIGAYFEGKLIGFIKMLAVGKAARLMHILSMIAHMDKMPMNALIAKAVEVCEERGFSHLTYGKYSYGNVSYTSLTEFKVRNGFKKFPVPRYYIPLTLQGQVALKMGIHRGIKNLVPEPVAKMLLSARARLNSLRARENNPVPVRHDNDAAEEKNVQQEETAIPG